MVYRYGGQVWRVRRPDVETRPSLLAVLGVPGFGGHASEQCWRTLPATHEVFSNPNEDEMLSVLDYYLPAHITRVEQATPLPETPHVE
jgi:hypothetical protein